MNKTGYIIIGLLALLIVGSFTLLGGKDDNSRPEVSGSVDDNLFGRAGVTNVYPTETCTWSDRDTNAVEYTHIGKLYAEISDKNNPSDGTFLLSIETDKGSSVETLQYQWMTGAGTDGDGVVRTFNTDKDEINGFNSSAAEHEASKEFYSKTCTSWSVDTSVFEVPSNVSFRPVQY